MATIVLTEKDISEGNRLIAEFLGYTYYHKGVDIDRSDIGGLYTRHEIFSKVPILVKEYPDDDECYFARLPNPDYGNENSKMWRSDIKELDWNTINHREFITDLTFHSSWDSLMPVLSKIGDLKGEDRNVKRWNTIADIALPSFNLEWCFHEAVCYLKWLKTKNKTNG